MTYSGQHGFAVEIAMHPDDWQLAAAAATQHMLNVKDKGFNDSRRNQYFTSWERAAFGYQCQLGFSRYLGISDRYEISLDGLQEAPDVAGYEVKSGPWSKAEHMDKCEGGRMLIPRAVRAKTIVWMTLFLSTYKDRVFFDGWFTRQQAVASRVEPQWNRHAVEYGDIHDPRTMPRL